MLVKLIKVVSKAVMAITVLFHTGGVVW